MATPGDVLAFWFGDDGGHTCSEEVRARWFKQSDDTDDAIRRQFGDDVAAARRGDRESWADTPTGRVALIILLDQFTRNLYRGSGEAFAADPRAQAHAVSLLDRGADRDLPPFYRLFALMPCMHAEDLSLQDRGVELFEALAREQAEHPQHGVFASFADYAVAHRDIVARFGRFPHRNQRLGRDTTDEEREFLAQPGSSFG